MIEPELTKDEKIEWFLMAGRENTGILWSAYLYLKHTAKDEAAARICSELRDQLIDENAANGNAMLTMYNLNKNRKKAA